MRPDPDFACAATADHPQLWRSGEPPCSGWYATSMDHVRDGDMRRFWHGSHWSAPCYADDPDVITKRARATPSESPMSEIEWCEPSAGTVMA